jgi:colicin import membrane protein
MPEANVLYSVTAAVVLGLVTWVAVVLKTAKEPWAREVPQAAKVDDDVPIEKVIIAETPAESAMTSEGAPVSEKAEAIAEAKAEAPAEAKAEAPAEAKAEAPAEAKAEAEAPVEAKAEADAKAEAPADAKAEADAKG